MSIRIILSAGAAMLAGASAWAQQGEPLPGRYGEITLQAGFAGDPRTIEVRAGGAMRAASLGGAGCVGFITEHPTYVVHYEEAGDVFNLMFSAASEIDTTMTVRTPAGAVLCDDDSAGNLGPGITVENPDNGAYEIWVGTYSSGVGYPLTALHISELDYFTANPFERGLDESAPAGATLSLRAGFRNDPASIAISQGGDVRLGTIGDHCWGYASEAPDARVTYRAGRYTLYISTESELDGTIAVLAPDGTWHCDDDSAGNLDPGVIIENPPSGEYAIWAGTFSSVGAQTATLYVSEIGFAGADNTVDVSGTPHHGSYSLGAGFSPDPFAMGVGVGGPVSADMGLVGHTIVEGFCNGYMTREPTMRLTWRGNGEPLYVSAASDVDTLLLVNAPDGGWWCDDDSAGNLDPGLVIDDARDGVYDIYVATFSPGETSTATVYISQTGWGAEAVSMRVDTHLEPRSGGVTLDPASVTLPYEAEVQAGGPLRAFQAGLNSTDYCVGHISREPTYIVNWTPDGELPFTIYLDAERDTTLAVMTPDGSWRCDDDGSVGLNAGINFAAGEPGMYYVYAGTFGPQETPATLYVAEGQAPR